MEVAKGVKKRLEEIKKSLPRGVLIHIAFDTSRFIEEAISDVQYDVFIGGLLAGAVMVVFLLSLRSTLITAIAIPTSLIASFGIMHFLGFTMNYMTMLGLSMMVGVVVDDAIVVLENTYRHMEEGESPVAAARSGTSEIAFAAGAATFSIVAVFLPVAFMGGIIGRFFYQFGVTVAASVIASLFVALTLIPMLCSRFLKVTNSSTLVYSFNLVQIMHHLNLTERRQRWCRKINQGEFFDGGGKGQAGRIPFVDGHSGQEVDGRDNVLPLPE